MLTRSGFSAASISVTLVYQWAIPASSANGFDPRLVNINRRHQFDALSFTLNGADMSARDIAGTDQGNS